MQNDFLHPDGSFSRIAMEHPEFNIDMPFLVGTISHVQRLADAFRAASRPVVYVAHILKPDYSDAAFPFWRLGLQPGAGNSTHCVEGTWGAEIIDELTHLMHGMAGIRWWVSHKALIAFTEFGVEAIQSTRLREPHPPCSKIASCRSISQPLPARKSPPRSMADALRPMAA
jgi:hypothetical protein